MGAAELEKNKVFCQQLPFPQAEAMLGGTKRCEVTLHTSKYAAGSGKYLLVSLLFNFQWPFLAIWRKLGEELLDDCKNLHNTKCQQLHPFIVSNNRLREELISVAFKGVNKSNDWKQH